MSDWRWEESTRRYRDQSTGRYMARSDVMSYVNESLAASGTATNDMGSMVAQGIISPADFETIARQEIKEQYITQYMLGRGGRDAMTQADWGSIGGMLRDQYHPYFDGFMADIKAGNLSEAQIQARLRMYVDSSRQAYEKAHERNAKDLGMDEESWAVDMSLENCEDCLAYRAEGWQEIGYFPEPADGSTRCLSHCGCEKLYRNSETAEEY